MIGYRIDGLDVGAVPTASTINTRCSMRIKLKTADEWDALTKAKKYFSWRAGQRKKIKRRYNKRLRRVFMMGAK